jgi:hypothetical protein
MKVIFGRCVVIAIMVLTLQWQGADAATATAAALIFSYLVFPNRPVE